MDDLKKAAELMETATGASFAPSVNVPRFFAFDGMRE
jgi:hypothetical protein